MIGNVTFYELDSETLPRSLKRKYCPICEGDNISSVRAVGWTRRQLFCRECGFKWAIGKPERTK